MASLRSEEAMAFAAKALRSPRPEDSATALKRTVQGSMALQPEETIAFLSRMAGKLVEKPVHIDEQAWRNSLVDLHLVMSCCKSLFVTLEHHREAMLRVSVEIVTCRQSRVALFWDDYWWSDDQKREAFKAIVEEKLQAVVKWKNGCVSGAPNEAMDGSDGNEAAALAEQELGEERAAREKAERALKSAELSLTSLRSEVEEAGGRATFLERSNHKLTDEVAQLRKSLDGDDKAKQLAEALSKLAVTEARLQEASEASAAGGGRGGMDAASTELAGAGLLEAQARLRDAEAELGSLRNTQKRLEGELVKERAALRALESDGAGGAGGGRGGKRAGFSEDGGSEAGSTPAALKAARAEAAEKAAVEREAEAAKGRLVAEEEAKRLSAELEEAQRELQELRAGAAGQAGADVGPDGARRNSGLLGAEDLGLGPAANSDDHEATLKENQRLLKEKMALLKQQEEELQDLHTRLEKQQNRMTAQAKNISDLKDDKEELEKMKLKILRTLHNQREQIKMLQSLAARRGMATVMEEMMQESGLTATQNSDEWSIFGRLYDDALRRQEKQRQWEANRAGGSTGGAARVGGRQVGGGGGGEVEVEAAAEVVRPCSRCGQLPAEQRGSPRERTESCHSQQGNGNGGSSGSHAAPQNQKRDRTHSMGISPSAPALQQQQHQTHHAQQSHQANQLHQTHQSQQQHNQQPTLNQQQPLFRIEGMPVLGTSSSTMSSPGAGRERLLSGRTDSQRSIATEPGFLDHWGGAGLNLDRPVSGHSGRSGSLSGQGGAVGGGRGYPPVSSGQGEAHHLPQHQQGQPRGGSEPSPCGSESLPHLSGGGGGRHGYGGASLGPPPLGISRSSPVLNYLRQANDRSNVRKFSGGSRLGHKRQHAADKSWRAEGPGPTPSHVQSAERAAGLTGPLGCQLFGRSLQCPSSTLH